jgi:hypothetical protein
VSLLFFVILRIDHYLSVKRLFLLCRKLALFRKHFHNAFLLNEQVGYKNTSGRADDVMSNIFTCSSTRFILTLTLIAAMLGLQMLRSRWQTPYICDVS